MAISVVGTASAATANATDPVVTLPAGIQADDVIYAAYCIGSAADRTGVMAATGDNSGAYSAVVAPFFVNNGEDINLAVYRKVVSGTADTTITFEAGANIADAAAAAVMVLRGVDTTTPEDATPTTASALGAAPNPPSITTVTNDAVVLAIGASSTIDAGVPTAPTNYGNLIEDQGDDTHDANIMMALRTIAVAGAENPGVFGNVTGDANDCWGAASVAVRPAAAAAGVLPVLVENYRRQAEMM